MSNRTFSKIEKVCYSSMSQTQEPVKLDILFIIDATKSMRPSFESCKNKLHDISFELFLKSKSVPLEFRYGYICYRDLVDNSNHEYPYKDFTKHLEELSASLDEVKGVGGRDFPEDWVGALNIAFEKISWDPNATHIIIWLADAPAHGIKYCGKNNHDEEIQKLDALTERLVTENYYFYGYSIDGKANQTYKEMKQIYDKKEGSHFYYEVLNTRELDDSPITKSLTKSAQMIATTILDPLLNTP